MLGLITLLVAADWNAWYEAQAKLRSATMKPEHMRVLQKTQEECEAGDTNACVYMLNFRQYELKVLSFAVEQVQKKCSDGDRSACEGALYAANKFGAVYFDHPLSGLRAYFPHEVYKATCLRFAAHCAKIDLKACGEDPRCTISDDEKVIVQMRQAVDLKPDESTIKALAKDCGDAGVAICRPKEMAFFKKDCPTGSGCFIAAYDSFLRTTSATHESEMYAVLSSASPATPPLWLADARTARCLREQVCDPKDKPVTDKLRALDLAALSALNVYTHPATAIVVNELVEKKVQGNAKLAEALANLEGKRSEFNAVRKQKVHEASTVTPQLPGPRTASQSALVAFLSEREAEIAAAVARYAQ